MSILSFSKAQKTYHQHQNKFSLVQSDNEKSEVRDDDDERREELSFPCAIQYVDALHKTLAHMIMTMTILVRFTWLTLTYLRKFPLSR